MIWKALCHPNVLPLLGATMTETKFMMVSVWMENGNINDFVKGHTNTDRLGLVCCYPQPLPLLATDSWIFAVA